MRSSGWDPNLTGLVSEEEETLEKRPFEDLVRRWS